MKIYSNKTSIRKLNFCGRVEWLVGTLNIKQLNNIALGWVWNTWMVIKSMHVEKGKLHSMLHCDSFIYL